MCRNGRLIVDFLDPERADKVDAPRQFSGLLRRQHLAVAGHGCGTDVTGVFFPKGVRTLPHIHTVDQLLFAVRGRGVVGTEDGARVLVPGDWAVIPAGTWHWHGATPDESFDQVAIKHGGTTEWLEATDTWKHYGEYT